MTDPVSDIARATGQRLKAEYGASLPAGIEAALHGRDSEIPERYTDAVAIASLIVAIASLAWTVYNDLRRNNPSPPKETVARAIRLKLHETHTIDAETRRIIDVVAAETTQALGQ